MKDKKTFGEFIKAKRIEKHFSQKDLADILFVTEGAVSKWERGISYPDITLISDICSTLEISEHEFITASSDTETRKIKTEAHKFNIIRSLWIMIPSICYSIALLTCFVCNLATEHTLSWFFVVLSSLICAYTFIPTIIHFFKKRKLLVFSISSYLSLCLLLFTCSMYTNSLYWLLTSYIGIFIGYVLFFLPLILHTRIKFIVSYLSSFLLTILLLLSINIWYPFMIIPAILITCYCFIPVIVSAGICLFSFNGFLKTGICCFIFTATYYFSGYVINNLFGLTENHYRFDFSNWSSSLSGNVRFICFLSFLFISIVFTAIGFLKKHNK